MNEDFTEAQIQAALDACAEEPVHIPGKIQPFGWLLAYDPGTGAVCYASENVVDVFHTPLETILGQDISELFDRNILHALKNILSMPEADEQRQVIGLWRGEDEVREFSVSAWLSGGYVVLELEAQPEGPLLSFERMQEQTMLTSQVSGSDSIETLFEITTMQLRHLTGFDRVMIYRFDQNWNGAVIAESHSTAVEPYLGLSFPSFDIPAQARDIMARIPLRIIADIDQDDVPIRAANRTFDLLDLSLGETRATSKVHVQYLRNMGSCATMTLSVVVGGDLWGIISFHHRRPRIIAPGMRSVLKSFIEVFCLKLSLLQETRLLQLSHDIEDMQREIQNLISTEPDIGQLLETIGGRLCTTFEACGVLIRAENIDYAHGICPDEAVVDAVIANVQSSEDATYFTHALCDSLPRLADKCGAIAGVAAVRHSNEWTVLLFRQERVLQTKWAGDPKKTIEVANGNARLAPRGSFSTFLASVQKESMPWEPEDVMLVRKLWPLLSSALNTDAKRRFMGDLNRQRGLMIDELNHRVRNILALVQAVSAEAKESQSSLESYSKAIEARIRALAAAHTIGLGTSAKEVLLTDIILEEAQPYKLDRKSRVRISGDSAAIIAEMAAIFALTIHELMTNAAKYGALSVDDGVVDVTLKDLGDGFEIIWTETGGPPVAKVRRQGFGTTLILKAVPYELGGESSVNFRESGAQARLFLPNDILSKHSAEEGEPSLLRSIGDVGPSMPSIPEHFKSGLVLIVEDNFIIAKGVARNFSDLGFKNIETVASLETAMEFLETRTPSLALLDVNLGQGQSSEAIAEELLDRNVPVIFATGYGELSGMSPRLSKVMILTKPISRTELAKAIERLPQE